MRDPAPPHANEGPHALWHVSGESGIQRFEPRLGGSYLPAQAFVWAIDTRHLPLYWFPRECPRATFWAGKRTTAADVKLLGGSERVHAIEDGWIERMRAAEVFAYRLPAAVFERHPDVGGYWLSRVVVEPLETRRLHDLAQLHEQAGIELRVIPNLWPLWSKITSSTLEFSGIRLRNARPAPA